MAPKRLHVGYVSAELAPFAKTGGLADTAAALPKALARAGHKVTVFVPRYGQIPFPPGDFAGRLIEEAGLKGLKRGGAMVSDKHANFILNVDDASAADIEALIGEVQAAVQRTSGVLLEPEVRVIGEPLETQAKGGR